MKTVETVVIEMSDLIQRALAIRIDGECPGGTNCPRCRLTEAATELRREYELETQYFDDMLKLATVGLPVVKSDDESDEALRRKLATWIAAE